MIPAQNYINRRAKLAQVCEQDLIVIAGGDLVQKSSDETYEFEQDGYFYYLTGVDEPGWILVMDLKKGSEFLIATNESEYHGDVWEIKLTSKDTQKICGIGDVRSANDGWGYIQREAKNYQSIGALVPPVKFSEDYGMFINPAKVAVAERLKEFHRDANCVDISGHIRLLRTVKDEDEIAQIRSAIEVTKSGLEVVASKLLSYENEAQIYADCAYEFLNRDSEFGYKPVIASGKNAAVLHYKLNNAPVNSGDMLLIDVGAQVNRYTADVTRTYRIGDVTKRQQAVYDAVAAAHAESLSFLKPGVSMRDHELHIEQFLGERLTELGVITDMLRKSIRRYYPHAISHHLGLDVHDSCSYEAPLEPGVVMTVEPGIYLPDEGIGVRIEDDILITKSGIEVLSKDIPH